MSALLATGFRSASCVLAPARSISQAVKNGFAGRVCTPHATFATQTKNVANRQIQAHASPNESLFRKVIGVSVLTTSAAGFYGFLFHSFTNNPPYTY